MSNREFMQTLDTARFEAAMHAIYFEGYIKKGSTPSCIDVVAWLHDDCTKHQLFWNKVLN